MKDSEKQRRPQIGFEASPELVNELKNVADATEIPQAVIAREALWEKLASMKKTHPRLIEAQEPALAK